MMPMLLALGERWKGAGENGDDVVFVTVGTGVGGGVVAKWSFNPWEHGNRWRNWPYNR